MVAPQSLPPPPPPSSSMAVSISSNRCLDLPFLHSTLYSFVGRHQQQKHDHHYDYRLVAIVSRFISPIWLIRFVINHLVEGCFSFVKIPKMRKSCVN
ncbi:hypothetical protein BLOT_006182, partial [Blomia tropicalis]